MTGERKASTECDRLIRRYRELQLYAHKTYIAYLDLYKLCCEIVDTHESGDFNARDEALKRLSNELDRGYPSPN